MKHDSAPAAHSIRQALACMVMMPCFMTAGAAGAADPSPQEPVDQREWKIIVSPYVWGAALNGRASVLGVSTDVNVPFTETLENLDFAVMGNVEVSNGVMGAYFDGQYADVSTDKTIRSIDIGASMTTTMLSGGVYYRIYEAQLGGETVFGTPRTFAVEPTVGLRWTRLSAELKGAGRAVSASESWTDPFVGSRVSLDLTERWNLAAEGDVGGFGIGSRLSLNGQAYLGYRTTLFGHNSIVRAGYRALYQDYENKDFHWDVTQHGPVLGVSMQF